MPTITIRPLNGLLVPDPALKDFLPIEGRTVEHSLYWQRRIRDNEVEPVIAKANKTPQKKSSEE